MIYYFLYNKGSVQLTNGLYYQNAFVRWSCETKCPFPENQCCKSLFGFKAGPHKPSESMMFLSYTTVLASSLRSELGVTHFERKRLFSLSLGTRQFQDMVAISTELKTGAMAQHRNLFSMTKIKLEKKNFLQGHSTNIEKLLLKSVLPQKIQ